MPDCVNLTPKRVAKLQWLPKICAYRLIHEGKDLPLWHYLVSGDKETVHQYIMSAKDRAISENDDDDLEKTLSNGKIYELFPSLQTLGLL